VDVPSTTEQAHMDGEGGSAMKVSWPRYSGVRRNKSNPEQDATPYNKPLGPKRSDMWTEITKDLV
jgi:hypothetical protein